ncbi:Rep family protein [Lactococcus garvieae]|uniref:Rep family protein n=1 Tax=Lactococcus garvieae TaxID=1363 RepID=UPI0002F53796|nr:Rep family protein [Lactococcus garvieae]
MNKIRIKNFVFEQYFDQEFWDWEEDKKEWFMNWKEFKENIFQEIYDRLKFYDTEDKNIKVAMIVHDKDKKWNDKLIEPHIHVYVELPTKRSIERIADRIGISQHFIEYPKGKNRFFPFNEKAYLIHAQQPDKYQYEVNEVETFETIDYEQFVLENEKEFLKRSATVRYKTIDESLDLIFDKVLFGKITYDEIMEDETLYRLYANNEQKFISAFNSFAQYKARKTLKALKNKEFKMSVIYIQGKSGIGKSHLAGEIVEKICEESEKLSYEGVSVYSASASNPFDEYKGEEILLLDDLRPDSLERADWLKVLDPMNKSRISARYRNKAIASRVIVLTNTETAEQFFKNIKNEDLDQYIRRINLTVGIDEKQFPRFDYDSFYRLSESKKLLEPKRERVNEDEFIELRYGFEPVFSTENKEEFLDRLVHKEILPKSFPVKG